MKKVLLTLVVVGAAALSTFAQSSSSSKSDASGKFSIGVDAGLPVGSTSDVYSFVIGGDLKYEMPFSSGLAWSLSAGYSSTMLKSEFKDEVGKSAFGYVPVKAGIKYTFDQSAFFVEGQLGVVFGTQSGSGTAFVYAPGVGYKFTDNLDLGVRYEGWSHDGTFSQVAARLAYSF